MAPGRECQLSGLAHAPEVNAPSMTEVESGSRCLQLWREEVISGCYCSFPWLWGPTENAGGRHKQDGCRSGVWLAVSAFNIIALVVTLPNPIVSRVCM